MDKKTAEKASSLLATLEQLREIQEAMKKEDSHWWSFLAPNVKRWDEDGLRMPDILRDEFEEAVKNAITKTKTELEKL